MSATAEMPPGVGEPKPTALTRPDPKVNQPHAWAGRMVFYWRQTGVGEISPLPAMLIEPMLRTEGWNINAYRLGKIEGRMDVKFSEKPKAGCWTWGPLGAPKTGK